MNAVERLGFVSFVKRVGIIAGAMIAVITVSNTIGGFVMRQAMVPIAAEIQRQIALEAKARLDADDRLTLGLRQLSEDRVAVFAILTYPSGPARDRLLQQLRSRLMLP